MICGCVDDLPVSVFLCQRTLGVIVVLGGDLYNMSSIDVLGGKECNGNGVLPRLVERDLVLELRLPPGHRRQFSRP